MENGLPNIIVWSEPFGCGDVETGDEDDDCNDSSIETIILGDEFEFVFIVGVVVVVVVVVVIIIVWTFEADDIGFDSFANDDWLSNRYPR